MVTAFGDLASAAAAPPPPWPARSVLRVVQRGEAEVGLEVQHVMELQADRCVLPTVARDSWVAGISVISPRVMWWLTVMSAGPDGADREEQEGERGGGGAQHGHASWEE